MIYPETLMKGDKVEDLVYEGGTVTITEIKTGGAMIDNYGKPEWRRYDELAPIKIDADILTSMGLEVQHDRDGETYTEIDEDFCLVLEDNCWKFARVFCTKDYDYRTPLTDVPTLNKLRHILTDFHLLNKVRWA